MIENQVNKVLYIADGSQREWAVSFDFENKEDVSLYILHKDQFEEPTKITSNFEWNQQQNAIVYPTVASGLPVLEKDTKVLVIRNTPATQLEDSYRIPFTSQDMERALDKLTMEVQDNREQVERSLRVPQDSVLTPNELMKNLLEAEENAGTASTAAINAAAEAKLSQQAAESANQAAQQAKTDAESAKTYAESAAQTATSKASESAQNASQAEASKTLSEQYAQTATEKASEATASAAEAQSVVATHNIDTEAHADIRAKISTDISAHNQSDSAHEDIRIAISGKAEQTTLSAHTTRTDNPHAVTKAQVGLGNVDNTADADKPVSAAAQAALDLKADSADVDADISDINSDISDINAALERKQDDGDFHPEDYGWPDIRFGTPSNSAVLLVALAGDFSEYDNFGFVVNCEGGYNVFIDGVQYGTTYASGSQCSITWSQYSTTTGFPVTQPEALTAHIVQIVPEISNNSISYFKCARVASSGTEEQGVLWVHLPQDTQLPEGAFSLSNVLNSILTAITTDSGDLAVYNSGIFQNTEALVYVPILECSSFTGSLYLMFQNSGIRKIVFKNLTLAGSITSSAFEKCKNLQEVKFINCSLKPSIASYMFSNSNNLLRLPPIDFSETTSCQNFISYAVKLKDTLLNFTLAKNMTVLGAFGNTTSPSKGIKGVLVSANAPFTGSAPQINISYTGLDRNALVALFKSLPYNVGYTVVGNPTIQDGVVSGFSEENRIQISSNFSFSAKFELCGKFKTPSSYGNTGANEYIRSYNTNGYGMGIFLSPTGNLEWNIFRDSLKQVSINTDVILPTETDVWYKAIYDSQQFILKYSTDGINYITLGTNAMLPIYSFFTSGNRIGSNASYKPTGFFSEIIYLQEFNETVNGVPWFRGAAAMEKTINITGATGAAALTSEQLAIATNKGWTITR